MDRAVGVGLLRVCAYDTSRAMGFAAAQNVGERLRSLLDRKQSVRAVFAAAASQERFLDALAIEEGIDWSRVEVLQLDEYVGLGNDDPRSLCRWLANRVTERLGVGHASYMRGDAESLADECARFQAEVEERPIDLGLIGIGRNGHLGYNDPHVADFSDPCSVKVVEIDATSRAQAVRDRAFPTLGSVPHEALTLTMSAILRIQTLSVVVPGAHKATAVTDTLLGPISPACPASSLRQHADAKLWVDAAAFKQAGAGLMSSRALSAEETTGMR